MKFNKTEYKRLEDLQSREINIPIFENDNPEKRAKRINQVQRNSWTAFDFFAKTYFPHVVNLEFCSAHRYMFNVVQRSSGVTAITGFRGLGKSAMFAFIYPIWKLIKGEKNIIYGAANLDQAEEKKEFIAHEFENNKRLLHDFPFLKIKDIDDNVFFLKNNAKIRAVSIKQTIRGTMNSRCAKRPGLIILDDIDEETNVGNMTIGHRKKNKILKEIQGTMDPKGEGKVLWLGNLTHPNFAICQFKDQIIGEIKSNTGSDIVNDNVFCLYGNEKRIIQIPLEKNGKSLWEAQYPTVNLPKIKEKYGQIGYLQEFLGKSIIEGKIFKASWFITAKFPPDREMREVKLYIDSAWGRKGCFRSIFAIGFNGYNYYVLKAWCRQCESSKMYEYLYQIYGELTSRFGVRVSFFYEANFGQTRIMDDFKDWCEKRGKYSISYQFRKVFNTENKNLRIEALEPVIESGKIVFCEGQDMQTVIGQFTAYPDGYLDAPDALAGCMERFSGYGRKKGIRVRGMK